MNKSVQKKVICSLLAALNATSVMANEISLRTERRSKSAINIRSIAYPVLGFGMGISYLGYSYKKGKFPFNKTPLLPPTPQPNPKLVISTPCLTSKQIEYWKNNLKFIATTYGNARIGVKVKKSDPNANLDKSPFIKHLGDGTAFECDGYKSGMTRLKTFLCRDSVNINGIPHYSASLEDKLKDLQARKPDFAERGEKLLRLLGYEVKDDKDINTLADLMRQNNYFDEKHTCVTISLMAKQEPNGSRKVWFAMDADMREKYTYWEQREQFTVMDGKGLSMKFDYGLFFADGNCITNHRKYIYKIYSDKVEKLKFPEN